MPTRDTHSNSGADADARTEAARGAGSVLLDPDVAASDGSATAVAARRVDAVTAMLRHPVLVILPIVILGVAGALLGTKKTTQYSAVAQVLVGQPSPATAGQLPGVVQAEQSLAGIYARELDFNGVVIPIASEFHTTPAAIVSSLSATPDPTSPIVKITAHATTPAEAVALANATARKFASYVTTVTQSGSPADAMLKNYRQAASAFEQASAREQKIYSTSSSPTNPSLVKATVAADIARLHENTVAQQYQGLVASQQNSPTLQLFESATTASGNHKSNLEIYAFAGVVAGLLIGAALATLVSNRGAITAARAA